VPFSKFRSDTFPTGYGGANPSSSELGLATALLATRTENVGFAVSVTSPVGNATVALNESNIIVAVNGSTDVDVGAAVVKELENVEEAGTGAQMPAALLQ
jgi:hypothetical protein